MKKMKFVLTALLACCLAGAAWADLEPITTASTSERLDSLEAQTNRAFAKAGILFGGEFYSRALSSKIDGNLVHNQTAKTTENVLYTGLDLSIIARPVDAIGGVAVIRMHQDWRNMFGSMANPLTLRWIAIEGNARNLLTYSLGDFRQKYTPLTLWVPEPEIMFEPTIFARQRQIAMGEEFLGGNNRNLQGGNFNFGARVSDNFQELRMGAFAARLRQTGQEMGNEHGTPIGVNNFGVDMDRYSTGFNTDMKFIPGTQVGGTFLYTGDAKRTSKLGDDVATWVAATSNSVFSGRARVGSELFAGIDTSAARFGLGAEFAGSNYMTNSNVQNQIVKDNLSGTAFKGGLDGAFRFGGQNGLSLDAGFMANQWQFRNEMAQSPALFNRRVLNSSTPPLPAAQGGLNSYNIFDALYTSVFSYAAAGDDGTGVRQPIKKSAWTRGTLTWEEIAANPDLIEQILSSALPLGEATPNRSGLVADLNFDFLNRAILLGANVRVLSEMQNVAFGGDSLRPAGTASQEFTEFGGGASFNIARFGDWWSMPFIISGSYRATMVDNFAGAIGHTNDISFVNAGLYWQFWRTWALMGGYQLVGSTVTGQNNITMTTNQSQWAAGFEYTIAEGGILNATIGQVMVDHSSNEATANNNQLRGNFSSLRLDLNLTVKF